MEKAAHSIDRMLSLYFDDFFKFNYFPFCFLGRDLGADYSTYIDPILTCSSQHVFLIYATLIPSWQNVHYIHVCAIGFVTSVSKGRVDRTCFIVVSIPLGA